MADKLRIPPWEGCVLQPCFSVSYYTMERCNYVRHFVFPCFRGIGRLFRAGRLCCGKTTYTITRALSRTSFCRYASSTNGAEEEKNDNPQLKTMKKGKSKGTVFVNLRETKKEVSVAADLGSVNPGVSNRWKSMIGKPIDQSISIDKIS